MAHPPYRPQMRPYQDWLREQRGLNFDSYDALWRWSTTDLPAFWQSLWEYFQILSSTPHRLVPEGGPTSCVHRFPGAQVNYAQQVLRNAGPAHAAGQPAIISEDERGRVRVLSWPELRRQVASLALALQDMGVQRGDRVAAYLPNNQETVVAFLACASIGAVWCVCGPDMETAAVLDRFRQIEPRVLIAADGVHYGGKPLDRSATVDELRDALPNVGHLVTLRTPYAAGRVWGAADFDTLTDRDNAATASFEPAWLPFEHPLWVVHSGGTTGLPMPTVHGHGRVLMATLAGTILRNDLGPSYAPNSWGERLHWHSSTGCVMWNAQIAGLAGGTTIVLFDGSPGGSKEHPDWHVLWRFAARHRVTFFGAGAAYYAQCMQAGVDLAALQAQGWDLGRIRALGSTGPSLADGVQRWGSAQFQHLGSDDRGPVVWHHGDGFHPALETGGHSGCSV